MALFCGEKKRKEKKIERDKKATDEIFLFFKKVVLWQRGVFSVCRKRAGAAAWMRLSLLQGPPTFRVSFDVLFRSKQEGDERKRITLKPECERSDGS